MGLSEGVGRAVGSVRTRLETPGNQGYRRRARPRVPSPSSVWAPDGVGWQQDGGGQEKRAGGVRLAGATPDKMTGNPRGGSPTPGESHDRLTSSRV